MHTPEQPEEKKQEVEHASTPLYEFPADSHFQNPYDYAAFQSEPLVQTGEGESAKAPSETHVLPSGEDASIPSHEAGARGFVYPPPPSYYQNMTDPAQIPPLPPAITGTPLSYPATPFTGQGDQTYLGNVQSPPILPAPMAPPAKRSRKWIWIIVSIFSVAFVASCGLCSWASYNLFSTTYQQVSNSLNVVNGYYAAIQTKNYHVAYSYLAPQGAISGLTEEQFTQQAQNRDDQNGRVLSYTPGQPMYDTSATTGPNLSKFTITINVSRTNLDYAVLLTVSKIGGDWKITDFDRI